ncbi:hypothetical protein ACTOVN_04875 [Arcanobacterium canis]
MKNIAKMMVAALVAVVTTVAAPTAWALDKPDDFISGKSRLTVTLPTGNPYDDVKTPPLDGYTVKLLRVQLDVHTKADYDHAATLKYDAAIKLGTQTISTKTTGTAGVVTFHDLDPALYVVQTELPQGRKGVPRINPALVLLPGKNSDGSFAYRVMMNLKRSPKSQPTPPPNIPNPSPTPTPTPRTPKRPPLPRTGASVAGTGVVVTALIIGGVLLARKKKGQI